MKLTCILLLIFAPLLSLIRVYYVFRIYKVFVENRITSHKQLPAAYYQIGPKFRNEITVFNESGQEVIVYLNILHDGNDKVYKSETARVEPYAKWSLDFDYDDEWHDLVRDVKKKLKTKENDASAYEFEFHFKNDGMFLDKMSVVDGDLEIHVKSKGFDF